MDPFAAVRRRVPLDGGGDAWRLYLSDAALADPACPAGEPIPATVPGCFERDLHAAGRIPEPFVGLNVWDLRRYERMHLVYARTFDADPPAPGEEAWLVLDGVDTYADVYLNGVRVGSCDNFFVAHEWEVGALLRPAGEGNEFVVHVRPAAGEAAARYPYPPGLGGNRPADFDGLYVRKPAHMWGWDIFPRAVSGGLWRPLRIEYRPAVRLGSVYLETLSASEKSASLALYARVLGAPDLTDGDWELVIDGQCGDSAFSARQPLLTAGTRLAFSVPSPRRWWPRGRGEAALYSVTVRLLKDGTEVDRAEFRHGIRTVELRRTETTDPAGSGEFVFVVNGERVFVHGANWVPADAYPAFADARAPELIDRACDLNCNMLRVWGGGFYESDRFYDMCDERGLLVWQDFMLACALYPQDDDFAARFAAEARAAVRRLRQHACVALWAGDNECDEVAGWLGRPHQDPNGNRLTRGVLPRVLREEDPGRPFLPSSPYIGPEAFAGRVRKEDLPESHLWGPRDAFKGPYYTGSLCHFASEIGYHGCPDPDSVRRFISAGALWPPSPDNAEWNLHSTWPTAPFEHQRVALMSNQIRELFGTVPDNLDDYAFASQCVQAEALKFFVEWFRAGMWRRTGILWWNLADGWPQFSDAVIDYYGREKLACAYLRRAQQPLHLILREPAAWRQELVASNVGREPTRLTRFSVRDAETGEILLEGTDAPVPGDAVTVLGTVPFSAGTKRFLLLDWESDTYGPARSHYLAGHPPFALADYRRWLAAVGTG
jgi:beta-mannosidase